MIVIETNFLKFEQLLLSKLKILKAFNKFFKKILINI